MVTIIKNANEAGVIIDAAQKIKSGGLVAFPTETVYGLGADMFNPVAVKKIFTAKGRPQDNPLIAHICDIDMLSAVTRDTPDSAYVLAKAFWPGPLTMVFLKNKSVPDIISCGLPTIAVRLPENTAARHLIKESKTPIAAPSANISGGVSPTKAAHVIQDLDGAIDMIIDGGECSVGIESTIVDLTGDTPVILRPGVITREMIINAVGECGYAYGETKAPKAPGMKYKHYAPKAKLTVIIGRAYDTVNAFIKGHPNVLTGALVTEDTAGLYDKKAVILSVKPEDYARKLYAYLRLFDQMGVDVVFAEAPPFVQSNEGLMNRLQKAAGYDIIPGVS